MKYEKPKLREFDVVSGHGACVNLGSGASGSGCVDGSIHGHDSWCTDGGSEVSNCMKGIEPATPISRCGVGNSPVNT
jgi:hypothetical protein